MINRASLKGFLIVQTILIKNIPIICQKELKRQLKVKNVIKKNILDRLKKVRNTQRK